MLLHSRLHRLLQGWEALTEHVQNLSHTHPSVSRVSFLLLLFSDRKETSCS